MKSHRNGFTLIELLVVISIITLMISILLPTLKAARDASKRVACASNMRQINIGLAQYGLDQAGQYPSSRGYGATTANEIFSNSWETMLQQDKYLPGTPREASPIFHCPSDPLETVWTWGTRRSYAANRGNWSWTYGWWGWPAVEIRAAKMEGVKRSSEFITLVENAVPASSIFGYVVGSYADEAAQRSVHTSPAEPQAGNFTFADGHGGWLSQSVLELNRGYWSRTGVIEDLSNSW